MMIGGNAAMAMRFVSSPSTKIKFHLNTNFHVSMYFTSVISTPTVRLYCSIPTEPSWRTNPSLKMSRIPSRMLISSDGDLNEAFKWLNVSEDDSPTEAYASVIELCGKTRTISQVRQLHSLIFKTFPKVLLDFVAGKLVFLYGKCGSLDDAEKVFDEMRERTAFAWNAMIGAYVSNGESASALAIYRKMRTEGIPVDLYSFPVLLKACGKLRDIRSGTELHCILLKLSYESVDIIANALVSMYAKNDDINAARRLFDGSKDKRDVVLWNSLMSSYSTSETSFETFELFREMQLNGPSANSYSFVSALTACKGLSYVKLGKEIHAAVLKSSYCYEVYVCNALIAMYTRCGKMLEAGRILHHMDNDDVVTWNSLIKGYIQSFMYKEALEFFRGMIATGHKPDEVSVTSVIAASGRLGNLLVGMELHAYVIKHGWDSNLEVGNTLIDMYSKCNFTGYMGRAFLRMLEKDVISWTTVIAGYAQNDCHVEALELFRDVAKKRMEIDEMMLGSILRACSVLKPMLIVKEIHCHILRKSLLDTVIQNELVDVYGKCKNMDYASRIFESIRGKDVVSWTSMISSSSRNGYEIEAVELFRSMVENGFAADSIALLCILSAAARLSALKKGREIHGYLLRKGFCIEGSIAVAVVDMYACCGDLQSAKVVFDRIERKNLLQYTSMINAYGMHGYGKASVELFNTMRHENNVTPDHISFLALLYACSHGGLLDEGRRFIKIMEHGYKLEPWPEHYVCLVDMLGRANRVIEAFEFVKTMKTEPTTQVWCALLAACRSHSEKEVGEIAAQKLLELEPKNPGNLVLVSNVFAEQGRWDDVKNVRAKMKASGLEKQPGCSWIEIEGKVHSFTARDKSHPETKLIYEKLSQVTRKLEKEASYEADTKLVLHNVDERDKVQMLHEHSERLAIVYGLIKTPDQMCLRITKNLRVCSDCHNFCKLVSKLFTREIVMRDANRFHHFENGLCSCGDSW